VQRRTQHSRWTSPFRRCLSIAIRVRLDCVPLDAFLLLLAKERNPFAPTCRCGSAPSRCIGLRAAGGWCFSRLGAARWTALLDPLLADRGDKAESLARRWSTLGDSWLAVGRAVGQTHHDKRPRYLSSQTRVSTVQEHGQTPRLHLLDKGILAANTNCAAATRQTQLSRLLRPATVGSGMTGHSHPNNQPFLLHRPIIMSNRTASPTLATGVAFWHSDRAWLGRLFWSCSNTGVGS
jgi:hypothetical protein